MVGGISLRRIGILGGMGPLAGVELARRIVIFDEAERDQEHVPFVLANIPQIPDRTAFLEGEGEDPRPAILEGIRILERAGCEAIFMACNTAYVFYEYLERETKVPIFHMPAKALERAKELDHEELLLLSTIGTAKSGIYQKLGEKYGLRVRTPPIEVVEEIHSIIYSRVKAGFAEFPSQTFRKIEKIWRGEAILLGCTELSLLKPEFEEKFEIIDPIDVTAEYAIKFSRREISEKDLRPIL